MARTDIRKFVFGCIVSLIVNSTAEAAKGIKKVAPATTQHTTTGQVVSVALKNGSGSFLIRTAQHHKKTSLANPVAGAKPQQLTHEFHVIPATRILHSTGTPASLTSLHTGVNVRVRATGQQADTVQILAHHSTHRSRGYVTRHRVHSYRPYLYIQHHGHRLHPRHHHHHVRR